MSENNGATPEQLNALSEPIPRALVKSATQGSTTFSYVTARTVMNWLDRAVGRGNWKTEYRIIAGGNPKDKADPMVVECTLSVLINGQWVGKADVGIEDNFSPQKAAYSNALKRAGAQWGIARELYGEGNVHEEDDAPAEPPARNAQHPPAPAPASQTSADASGTSDVHDHPFANDGRIFEARHVPAMKQAIVECGLATETNHAQNTIVAAMVGEHNVDGGLSGLFGEWTNSAVWAAVIEYRTAEKEG